MVPKSAEEKGHKLLLFHKSRLQGYGVCDIEQGDTKFISLVLSLVTMGSEKLAICQPFD